MSGLVLVTAPTIEPVTLAEMKDHLRIISDSSSDTYIKNLIKVAREAFEHDTGRKLITQTWDYVLDGFPSGDVIEIPYPPLQSVTSVKYNDADSVERTFSSSNYTVDTKPLVGRIVLKSSQSWPTTNDEVNPVTIRFVCGYGDDYLDVPETDKHAVKFLVAHWYDVRSPVVAGMTTNDVPLSYRNLMNNRKVHSF